MKSISNPNKKQLLSVGVLMGLSKTSDAAILSEAEAQKISVRLARLVSKSDSLSAGESALLQALGLNELRGVGCEAVASRPLSYKDLGATGDQIFRRVLTADPDVQELSRKLLLQERALSGSDLETLAKNPFSSDNPIELSFRKPGILFNKMSSKLDRIEAYSVFSALVRAHVQNDFTPTDVNRVYLEELDTNRNKDKLWLKATLVKADGEKYRLVLNDLELRSGEVLEEVVAKLLLAASFHDKILSAGALEISQEINALRYELIKLYRLSASENKAKLGAIIDNLRHEKKAFFGDVEEYKGRRFAVLMRAKEDLLALGQRVQAFAVGANAITSKLPPQTEVEHHVRSDASRPLYRQGSTAGYYYPSRSRGTSYDSSPWIYDPTYMYMHPWYYGVDPNYPLRNYVLMDMMVDHSRYPAEQSYFQDPSQIDMAHFVAPIEPKLLQDPNHPFLDFWESVGESVSDGLSDIEWNDPDTAGNGTRDFGTGSSTAFETTSPTASDSASTGSGWTSSPSTERSYDTTPTPTETTTTGSSWFSTTGTSTTTTGWDSTTTTGSYDSTTTTGSYDSTTTGSYDSTGSSTGGDF